MTNDWGAAKVFGKLKSFNRKPQACALGMDESLSAVIANTHACGLRLNDLSDRQGKLPHPNDSFPFALFAAFGSNEFRFQTEGRKEREGRKSDE